MKIIEQISDNQFVIELEDKALKIKGKQLKIMHDYVQVSGIYPIWAAGDADKVPFTGPHSVAANTVNVPMTVQIGIRSMIKTVIPLLKDHEYLQEEHIADRTYTEDSSAERGFKKGDIYTAYSYYDQIVEYYDGKARQSMVAVIMAGEKKPNHVTLEFFNKFIRPTL
jgi:hypothetical protein